MSEKHTVPSPPAEPNAADRQASTNRLNEIGVLTRREIEARILAPLLAALGEEFGRERVLEIAARQITQIARQQGEALAQAMGGSTIAHFAKSLDAWQKDGALETEVLEQSDERFSYDVKRCRYAEMYRALGIAEMGTLLSCNRDQALIEGFNPKIVLRRTKTIMEGHDTCDFRYTLEP